MGGSDSRRQPPFPFFFRQLFNGISKHGTRHLARVLAKKIAKGDFIDFAHFAQHPTGDLVNQIVFMIQEPFGNDQGVDKITLFDEMKRRHHRDPLLPKMICL